MVRWKLLLLAGLALALPTALPAGDGPPPAGNWKVVVSSVERPDGGATTTVEKKDTPWLLKFEAEDGKWTGTLLAQAGEEGKPPTIERMSVDGDVLRFAMRLNKDTALRFEFRVPKEKDVPMRGSVTVPGRGAALPLHLEPTTLTSLEPGDLDRDTVARHTGTIEVVRAAKNLLKNATMLKAKPAEVRAWADKAVKSGEAYGPTLHRNTVLDVVELLQKQKEYVSIALQYARTAERLLEDKDPSADKKKVLNLLADVLEEAGKVDEAKEVRTRADKIAYVNARPFAGRKGSSDRVVLVELFTGAQCPPCVAADLAFDALAKTYKPTEVILLQHHLHIPGPDALTNHDTEDRAGYYGQDSTPAVLFDGKAGPLGGGSFGDAQNKYHQYTETLAELLEKPASATVKASATRKGAKVEIKAEVAGLKETGKDVRLYLALVEEQVAYLGRNKLPAHHCVVRAWPAGKEGVALTEKTVAKTVTVDLDDLRQKLTEYLDKVAKDTPFPTKDRPMELKKLRVVAFVQNDTTKEVYQATQAEVVQAE